MIGWPTKWVLSREWDSRWTSGIEWATLWVIPFLVYPFFVQGSLGLRCLEPWRWLGEEGGEWTSLFSRAFSDWELELVERFLQKIQVFKVHMDVEDRVIWIASRCGTFLVKSLYSILEPWDSPLFPSGSVWRSSAPHKVAFFAWEASWGKVLTLDQLQRRDTFWQRGIFCLFKAEVVDHLLHYAKTRVLWNFFFLPLWYVLDSCSLKDTLFGWHGSFVGKARKKTWQMTPLCIFWTI